MSAIIFIERIEHHVPGDAVVLVHLIKRVLNEVMNISQQIARDLQDQLLMETQLQNLRNDQNAATANLEQSVGGGQVVVRNEKLINLSKKITNLKSALAA